MSSSLGNFFTTQTAVAEYGADVVRTFLLSTAYHNRAVYSEETIAEATERWETLERGTSGPSRPVTTSTPTPPRATSPCARGRRHDPGEFERAMNDDFNTREALAALTELVGAVNVHVDGAETFDYQGLRAAIETLEEFGGDVLGLSFGDESTDGDVAVAEDLVELVLDLREREREAGNYERGRRTARRSRSPRRGGAGHRRRPDLPDRVTLPAGTAPRSLRGYIASPSGYVPK